MDHGVALDSALGFGGAFCVVFAAGAFLGAAVFLSGVAAGSGRAVSAGAAIDLCYRRGPATSIGARGRHDVEPARLLVAQRDRGSVNPDLERVASERPAHEHDLRPLDEAEHHQALNGGIGGLDRFDTGAITGLEIRECQTSAPRQARK